MAGAREGRTRRGGDVRAPWLKGAGLKRAGLKGAGLGRGESAGLPEPEELLQAAENAGKNGGNQGVYGRRAPGTLLQPRPRRAAQAGELVAEGKCVCFHGENTN